MINSLGLPRGSGTKTSTTHLSSRGRSSTFAYGGEFASGDVGLNTDTGVYGNTDGLPTLTAIANNCGTNSTAPAIVQADLARLHTEHVDRAAADLVFGGEHTEGGSGTGHLLDYVYTGWIHINGLASLRPG